MPNPYKYRRTVDYVEDSVGSDIRRDLMKVAIVSQDVTLLSTAIEQIGGQAQSAVDVAARIDALAAALASNGGDLLRVEQQTPVGIENTSGTQIDPLAAGNQPLDVSGATVPTEQQTPVGVENSSGTQIDPATAGDVSEVEAALQTHDQAVANDASLASGSALSRSVVAQGAETLRGRVVRASTSYDLAVDWEDSNGNVLFTDTIATGVAAGTETALNEPAISPYATVRVIDAGAASGSVTLSAHLR